MIRLKPAYSYYTDMMWRFYVHHRSRPPETFPSEIDHLNYAICDKLWQNLSDREQEIMTVIHSTKRADLPDAVHQYAAEHNLPDQAVWSASFRIARETGVERELVDKPVKVMRERRNI